MPVQKQGSIGAKYVGLEMRKFLSPALLRLLKDRAPGTEIVHVCLDLPTGEPKGGAKAPKERVTFGFYNPKDTEKQVVTLSCETTAGFKKMEQILTLVGGMK